MGEYADVQKQPDTLECLVQSNNALAEDIYARACEIAALLFGPDRALDDRVPISITDGVAPTLRRTNERLLVISKDLLGIVTQIKG